jgi:DNA repair exonuclease SbcCD nuclease subunit
MDGHFTNFPVSRDAPESQGLDYLALGDWHSFCEIPPEGATAPIVYPGAPEPTKFGEEGAGNVALVCFTQHGTRPRVWPERVSRWTWRQEVVRSVAQLKALAAEDLVSTVLQLTLDLTVSISEMNEVDGILKSLEGTAAMSPRVGAFVCRRKNMTVNVDDGLNQKDLEELPEIIRATAARLRVESVNSDIAKAETAKEALLTLHRLLQEVR